MNKRAISCSNHPAA